MEHGTRYMCGQDSLKTYLNDNDNYDDQHNTTQHNTTQHNKARPSPAQDNTANYNTTQAAAHLRICELTF